MLFFFLHLLRQTQIIGMKNRIILKTTQNNIFGLTKCQTDKKCNNAPIFLIITSKITNIFTTKMNQNQPNNNNNNNTNDRNSAIAPGPSLSFHNFGNPCNPGCSGISNLHGNRYPGRGYREESNILNDRHFYPNFYPPNIYYHNYVSFSSQASTEARNIQEIIKRQQQTLNKYRKWVPVSSETPTNGSYFTILNYNVLAQDLVQENAYLYKNHSPRACLWQTRWNNLYREITSYDADIICLQEVQQSHLNNYYKQFENIGYVGIYKKRTGIRSDGCALYYKKSLFKIIENTTVEFNQGTNALDRENVAIIARLAPKQHPDSEFVVATTHLLYNPKRMDVRLAQTQVLLAEVERIAHNNSGVDQYVPIIITGDFNSKPDSAVYKLIVEGRLKYDNLSNRTLAPIGENSTSSMNGKILISPHLKITDNCQHFEIMKSREQGLKLSRNDELPLINLRHSKRRHPIDEKFNGDPRFFSTGILSHKLNLLSAFKHINNDGFEATTHQNEWITVDYIFYSGKSNKTEDKLKLISNYRIPTTTELREIKYIPNFVIGSDHLPLLSKFQLVH